MATRRYASRRAAVSESPSMFTCYRSTPDTSPDTYTSDMYILSGYWIPPGDKFVSSKDDVRSDNASSDSDTYRG